jgi:hypothetical protein
MWPISVIWHALTNFYTGCIRGKQTQTPFPKESSSRATEVLELIHTDVCGPMRIQSLSGSRYFVTFIDDKSRWCEIFFLKRKKQVFKAFIKFKTLVENQFGKNIKVVRCLEIWWGRRRGIRTSTVSVNWCVYFNHGFTARKLREDCPSAEAQRRASKVRS